MKLAVCIAILSAFAGLSAPLTAREYYEELRATGTIKSMWKYACFEDNDQPSFKLMSKVGDIKADAKRSGDTAAIQIMQGRENDLAFDPYNKGIEAGLQFFYQNKTEPNSYSRPINNPFNGEMTYTVNWSTLRFRLLVIPSGKHVPPSLDTTGKCELIHPNAEPALGNKVE
jgi:hypothetical protein